MSLNLNSLNGPAPAVSSEGPPIGLIVAVVVVIVVVVVIAVMFGGGAAPPPPVPVPVVKAPAPTVSPAVVPQVPVAGKVSPDAQAPKKEEPVPSSINWIKKDNVAHYLGDSQYAKKRIGPVNGTVDECKAKCASNPECTHFNFIPPNSCTLFNGAEWVGSQPGSSSYCRSQCQT